MRKAVCAELMGLALFLAACGGQTGTGGGGGGSAETTWTVRTSGTDNTLRGVTHGSGTFVAVGDYGAILTSP
jgi:hypothetical protein